jgi:hypothetical protein
MVGGGTTASDFETEAVAGARRESVAGRNRANGQPEEDTACLLVTSGQHARAQRRRLFRNNGPQLGIWLRPFPGGAETLGSAHDEQG